MMGITIPPTTNKIEKRGLVRAAVEIAPVTLSQYAEAMKKHKGLPARVARELNLPVEVVRQKIKFTPILERLRRQLLEERLDTTEEKLMEQVESGNVTAITYTLTNLGKERGYGKGDDQNINVNVNHSAGLIKRLQGQLTSDDEWDENEVIESEDYEWVEADTDVS